MRLCRESFSEAFGRLTAAQFNAVVDVSGEGATAGAMPYYPNLPLSYAGWGYCVCGVLCDEGEKSIMPKKVYMVNPHMPGGYDPEPISLTADVVSTYYSTLRGRGIVGQPMSE